MARYNMCSWFLLATADAVNWNLLRTSVIEGQRPDKTEIPQDVNPKYEVSKTITGGMLHCWAQNPDERPEFTGKCTAACNVHSAHCVDNALLCLSSHWGIMDMQSICLLIPSVHQISIHSFSTSCYQFHHERNQGSTVMLTHSPEAIIMGLSYYATVSRAAILRTQSLEGISPLIHV